MSEYQFSSAVSPMGTDQSAPRPRNLLRKRKARPPRKRKARAAETPTSKLPMPLGAFISSHHNDHAYALSLIGFLDTLNVDTFSDTNLAEVIQRVSGSHILFFIVTKDSYVSLDILSQVQYAVTRNILIFPISFESDFYMMPKQVLALANMDTFSLRKTYANKKG
jgi:hypothetical protein